MKNNTKCLKIIDVISPLTNWRLPYSIQWNTLISGIIEQLCYETKLTNPVNIFFWLIINKHVTFLFTTKFSWHVCHEWYIYIAPLSLLSQYLGSNQAQCILLDHTSSTLSTAPYSHYQLSYNKILFEIWQQIS